MNQLLGHSTTYRIAAGPQQGRRVLAAPGHPLAPSRVSPCPCRRGWQRPGTAPISCAGFGVGLMGWALPSVWISTTVHYRHDNNCRVLYPKKYTERKAMNDSASCVPINVLVRQWGICNAQKHLQHFIKELAPQALPLLLVPCCCI